MGVTVTGAPRTLATSLLICSVQGYGGRRGNSSSHTAFREMRNRGTPKGPQL